MIRCSRSRRRRCPASGRSRRQRTSRGCRCRIKACRAGPDWFRAAEVRGANPPAAHSFTDSTDAMLAAVCGLVAPGAQGIAAPYIERGELIQLPGPMLKARFSYYVVHPAHRRPTPAAAAFIEWLRREAAKEEPAPSSGRGTSRSAAQLRRAPASGGGDRRARKGGGDRDRVFLQRPRPCSCDLAVDHDGRMEDAVSGIRASSNSADMMAVRSS